MARSADARAKRAAIARAEAAKTRETIRLQGGVKGHGINGVLTSKDRRVLRRKAAREGAADGGAAAPADDALAPADDASAPARAPDPAAGKKMELTAKERRRLKRAAERADGGAPPKPPPSRAPPPVARPEGVIRSTVDDRYGFIHADDEKIGRDLFFLWSALGSRYDDRKATVGERVAFDLGEWKGRIVAQNLTKVAAPARRAAAAARPPAPPPRGRAARARAALERVLALRMQGLAVHPELADSREDDELARALALSREQAVPPVSLVREDDDDDLAWALELSRASEPGSFDAGGADPWERVVDAQSGAPYWWNRDTDETTWDDPAAGRDGGGLSAALDGSAAAAAPFDTLEGMLRAVGLSDLAPALAAVEVDLETLKFLCLDDLVSDLGIPEAQAAALLAARDARERGLAGLA